MTPFKRKEFFNARLHFGDVRRCTWDRSAILGVGVVAEKAGELFPLGTLVVNVTGSFAIGFFAAFTDPEGPLLVSPRLRQFFMIGVCGGYTTFSSFSLQTLDLVRDGDCFKACLNSVLSFACCVAAVWLGRILALSLLPK
jgi:CrcB protein